MYSRRSVFKRIVLYILFIGTVVMGSWVYLAENYDSNLASRILEPIETHKGYEEFTFLQKTKLIPEDVFPIYLRSFQLKGQTDLLFFRMSGDLIDSYLAKQKKQEGYKLEDISELSSNKFCRTIYERTRDAFKVPEFFLPDFGSSEVKFGYVELEDDRGCKRIDIYDFENERVWYIKRYLK